MKRFYADVDLFQEASGYSIALDGKKIRTPSRQVMALPTMPLAEAIASEWRNQTDEIRPLDMPLTQLANTSIDQTGPHRIKLIDQVAAYGRTDLLCYRVATPPDLAVRQQSAWQPLLDWSKDELGVELHITTDLTPLHQPEESLLAIYTAVARLDNFTLTGLGSATAASGSIILSLALLQGRLEAEEACSLSQLDEEYQIEQWGDDPDAQSRRTIVRQAIGRAAKFMALSKADQDCL